MHPEFRVRVQFVDRRAAEPATVFDVFAEYSVYENVDFQIEMPFIHDAGISVENFEKFRGTKRRQFDGSKHDVV